MKQIPYKINAPPWSPSLSSSLPQKQFEGWYLGACLSTPRSSSQLELVEWMPIQEMHLIPPFSSPLPTNNDLSIPTAWNVRHHKPASQTNTCTHTQTCTAALTGCLPSEVAHLASALSHLPCSPRGTSCWHINNVTFIFLLPLFKFQGHFTSPTSFLLPQMVPPTVDGPMSRPDPSLESR